MPGNNEPREFRGDNEAREFAARGGDGARGNGASSEIGAANGNGARQNFASADRGRNGSAADPSRENGVRNGNGTAGENCAPENAAFGDCEMNAAAAGGAQNGSAASGEAAAKLSRGERRSRRRALISAPVRVRSIDVTGSAADEISTTLDVSRGGVLFVSARRAFSKGMEVAVTFPYSKSPVAVQAEQTGRVVRVTDMADGRQSIGVALAGVEGELVDAAGQKLAVEIPHLHDRSASSKKPVVLIVDADPAIRMSLKVALSTDGYEVLAVGSAAEGREILKILTPALLIAEIEGEELPGYELCAHVKSTPRLQTIPVMLLTSSAYPSDYSAAHSLGAIVCMAKPYRQERLRHVVRLLAPTAEAKAQTGPVRAADEKRRHCAAKSQKVVQPASDSVQHRPRTNF
jgi:CheY-like chemotaxis protein